MPCLMRKNDLIIWSYLSEVQQKIYNEFSHSEEVKEVGKIVFSVNYLILVALCYTVYCFVVAEHKSIPTDGTDGTEKDL